MASNVNSIHQSMHHNVINEKSVRELETLEGALTKLRRRLIDPLKWSAFSEANIFPNRINVLAGKRAN